MSGLAQRAHATLLPPLALAAALATAAALAALANCTLIAGLYKTTTNGLCSILLQLAIAEIALGLSISPELWSYNTNKNWIFGGYGCTVYRGLNVLTSIASAYLITTIALHTLAIVNLEERAIIRINRRNDQDDEEIRSSRHSLVAASDSSTPPRTMNLDYRNIIISIPILQPTVFVWILCLSLSIPDFALATIVELDSDMTICTIVDSNLRLHIYSVLALINLLLPTLLIIISLTLVAIKLRSKKNAILEQCESIAALKMTLSLIMLHLILCVPRFVFMAHNIYNSLVVANENVFEQAQDEYVTIIGMAVSFCCLLYIILRPIICIILLPNVKDILTKGHRNTVADV